MALEIHKVNASVAKNSLPSFGNLPKNLRIDLPRRLINPERIYIGDDVSFGPNSFLYALTHYPTVSMRNPENPPDIQYFDSKIVVGRGVTSTDSLQIVAHSEITIEDDVMFASNVHINDGFHGFGNANEPFKYQQISNISPIIIRNGCWIGQNVVVMPGVTIGEYAIIGANSVVNQNVPPRSIAVGSPAEIIKIWDDASKCWRCEKNRNG